MRHLFHPLLVSFLRMSSYVTDGDEPAKALETKKNASWSAYHCRLQKRDEKQSEDKEDAVQSN